MTVFLSSHLLYEVEQVCSKVAVVHRGRKVASGLVSELLANRGRLRVVVDRPGEAAQALRSLGGVRVKAVGSDLLELEAPAGQAAAVNALLVRKGFAVSALVPETASLEEFYFETLGGGDGDAHKT
jgi:ABC-2 type transport system ATP-binding protein